ncbi:MAG: hypothetical protein JO154_00010 [Chitinophaga sp.]|uniref:hypothetical protein n=1 Tax=Chitinophaga sp. TaxID=1869181 RepID=UPI0025C30CB9|nr:hypothetical protein [Chitinophaga sp.]MBV8250960.1 hypothetical protein [Chitinophaga sp.]
MKNHCLIVFLFLFYGIHTQAQTEHVFIQTDKSICYPGDTLWFRGYITNDDTIRKSSTNLFVEVYDTNNHLINRQLFPIIDNMSYGQLITPAQIGPYWIRAFTLKGGSEGIQTLTVRPEAAIDFTYRQLTSPVSNGLPIIPVKIKIDEDSCIVQVPDSLGINYAISITHMAYEKSADLLSFPVRNDFPFQYDTNFIKVTAKVKNNFKQKTPEIVTVFTKDSITNTPQILIPDSLGQIYIRNLFFFDSAIIRYSINNPIGSKKTKVELIPAVDVMPAFTAPKAVLYHTDTIFHDDPYTIEMMKVLSDRNIRNLKPVVVKARWQDRHLMLNKKYVMSKEFAPIEQFSFDLRNPVNPSRIYSVIDYLNQELPPLWAKYYLSSSECKDTSIQVYIDEKKVLLEYAQTRPLSDFAYAKAFQSLHPPCACLVLYTRKGEDLRALPSAMNTLPITGYSRSLTWTTPDLITYHWNPFVTTSTYKFKIPAKAFRVAIVGNTAEGDPIQISKVVQVP